MRAMIIRHGKVDFQWRNWSTSIQFNEDCKLYDKAPIFPLVSDGTPTDYPDIFISSLRRSRETADQLSGEKEYISTKLLDEVPLSAGITSHKRLPLLFWNVCGRLQWLFNSRSQKEGRTETVYRAGQFVEMIIKRDKDCMIVTHGFFMHTLIKQMRKQGFRIHHKRFRYSNEEWVIGER
ncbi:histidine phosphatase family protein [Acetatifactor muris]|uniref:histidine phosphatase family protein n=1 Tax=Acetatifactor muris TaxID=879566 RepID=UPI0023F15FA3|nr:histidine phosphatase family protein [Acetatifactor muris]